jgi:hypothetical protein
MEGPHWLYNAYFLMAAPAFFAVGLVSVIVRPFFLLSVAKFYTDLVDVKAEVEADIAAVPAWEKSLFSWHSAVFLVLLAMLLADVFFANQLGLTAWIKQLADNDLLAHYQLRQ